MKRFQGTLICTDLDGTLLKNDKTISKENKDAIEFFKSEGGSFTFVTGRSPQIAEEIHSEVNPNVPIGCLNGCGLYDFNIRDYMWSCKLPSDYIELVKHIEENMPDMGIQIYTRDKIYFCNSVDNVAMEYFRKVTGVPNITCNYNDVVNETLKVVFCHNNNDDILKVMSLLSEHPKAEMFDFVRSERTLYEILPKNISKATSLNKLMELMCFDKSHTIAIGDYNNDIPMIRAAGLGVAVANAVPDAIAVADYVTVSNEENAIARIIYELDSGVIKL